MKPSFDFHHIKGMSLYLTFCLYSRYPVSSFSRKASSLMILFAIISGYVRKMTKDIGEPRMTGIEQNRMRVALYMGCLTMP